MICKACKNSGEPCTYKAKIGNFCRIHSKTSENSKLTCKKEKDKTSSIKKRISTMQSASMKLHLKNLDINQPEFTKEDEKKKEEVWNYKSGYSAFSNSKCKSNKGDHIYGIRENINKSGISGSNTPWNLIPCTPDENSGTACWKKIPNSKKNLVYDFDNFTPDEIKNFDENTKIKYNKLKKWKEYCEERRAVLFYKDQQEIDKKIKKLCEETMNILENEVNKISQNYCN